MAISGGSTSRSARLITPAHYRLQLDPDGEAHTFRGEVAITLALAEAAPEVRLDCEDLEIDSAAIGGLPVPWRFEPGLLVLAPASPLPPGEAVAEIRFRGRLDAAPRGFYRGEGFLATQMQPTHARRVFPCFDDPRFRTVFDITVQVPAGQIAISNAPVLQDNPDGGRRSVTFAPSPAIPTHLLALAIGPFRRLPDDGGNPPLALHALHAPERCRLALQTARQALDFLGGWLARPYPFAKLDLVVLPHTGAAGMENSGAIFLRESVVALADAASRAAQREAANLVAHEVAHQWFGGLVTPGHWRDLWLNEGFATWLAAKAMAAIAPALARDAEEVRAIREALHGDTGPGARPLVAGGTSHGEIAELFDTIAYRKGAALLRMLQAWLGEASFQRGLRLYLERHGGGTATSEDLWRALQEACGQPVAAVAQSFATRAGAPRLAIRWSGETAEVAQIGDELSSIPVHLRVALDNGDERIVSLLLEGPFARATLPASVRWVFGDAGAVGYYRCGYPGGHPPIAGPSPSEAVVLLEDAWLALWNGETDLLAYLAVAREALTASAATPSLRRQLEELRELLAGGARAALFDGWVSSLAVPGDDEETSALLGGAGHAQAVAEALAKQLALLEDNRLDEWTLVPAVEALLAHPATRGACWALIKSRWDDLGHRLVGLGGRGVIAALAAFSDAAAQADIAGFFAHREVPGAERMLRASLGRIAGRLQFRESQQTAMDAFLMRLGAPAAPPTERLRHEHALLAALAAGFRGALLQRNLFDRFGLAAPPWMHTPDNLRGALGSAERQLALLHRGAPVVSRGDIELAQRLRDDLQAAAAQLAPLIAKLPDAAARHPFLTVAAGFARAGAMTERELEAALVFAALFEDADRAGEWRRQGAGSRSAFEPARAWIAQPPAGVPTRAQRLALHNEAVLVPGLLRLHANSIEAHLAALGGGAPPDPSAAWLAFGFDERAAQAWRAAGFGDPRTAAGWRLRNFDPATARCRSDEGADPAVLRTRPAVPATPARTLPVTLPDGTVFTVEIANDSATRAQGLMHRESVPARGGMLFAYPDERPRPITMRHVRMPLDVFWLDAAGCVVHLERGAPPWREAPIPQEPDKARCRFVLELPAGVAERHGLDIGAKLVFDAAA